MQWSVTRRRRSKRPRLVWAVRDPLRRIQRQTALLLRDAHEKLADCVTAFRKKASAFENARRHVRQPVVVTADVADFYDSITLHDVADLFHELGTGRTVAAILARLSTIDEKLMQGGRASPFIANLIGQRIDKAVLTELASEACYTRYVDDLTFSGPTHAVPSQSDVMRWLANTGFGLRQGSYLKVTKDAGPFVTGLNVAGAVPKIPQRLRRHVERFFYYANAFDVESAAARTFGSGKRSKDGKSALRYVRGLVDWLDPFDADLARDWNAKLAAL